MTRHGTNNGVAGVVQGWGIAPGDRVWLGGHDAAAKRALAGMLKAATRPASGPIDVGFIGPRSVEEAVYFASKLRSRLKRGGRVWVIYPAAEGVTNPTGVLGKRLAAAMDAAGFYETASARVSDTFSSTCFQPRPHSAS